MPDRPPPHVLTAFGVTAPLEPLTPEVFATAEVVLKRIDAADEARWIAQLSTTLAPRGLRIARPLPSRSGDWVVDSWTAWQRLDGETAPERWSEVLAVSNDLHAALATIKVPGFIARRTNPWAVADRVAWSTPPAFDIHPRLEPLFRKLRAEHQPIPTHPTQLIHGDLLGNVLFADGLPPAVIDLTPYNRPADYAKAIVTFDAIAWRHADALPLVRAIPHIRQLLIRAAIFRAVAASELALRRGETPTAEDLATFERATEIVIAA